MAKKLIGEVVSTKMDKTAVVAITRLKSHPLYQKRYRVTKRLLVHDPDNQLKLGDRVELVETRPLSRHKRWAVAAKLGANKELKQ